MSRHYPVVDLTQDGNQLTEPQCVEVEITASSGGKVQIVQFKLSNDFTFGYTEKYTIPTDWTPERLEEWRDNKLDEIKRKVDEHAQVEQDALLESSDWYTEG